MNKNKKRIKYKSLRQHFDDDYRIAATNSIMENAASWFGSQPEGYISSIIKIGSEIDLSELNNWIDRKSYHKLLLPKVVKDEMFFTESEDSDKKIIPTYCILPCICYDRDGNRIGYGKGYYDRFLSDHKDVISVIINFAKLETDRIVPEIWDRSANLIINENGIFDKKII